jgi:hypothetical protein
MDQHKWVQGCLSFYGREGIVIGDPEEGVWNDAHYPAPNGKGEEKLPLLFDHHQVQGILQSEEYGRLCFFVGDVKRFLTHGVFVSSWFELYDLYEKWSQCHLDNISQVGRIAAHSKRDDRGKSLLGVENAKRLHKEKDESGRSIHGVESAKKLHSDKNEEGKSVVAVRAAQTTNQIIHVEKNEEGKSVVAVKGGTTTSSQKWICLDTGHISTPGGLSRYQISRNIPTHLREKLPDSNQVTTEQQ